MLLADISKLNGYQLNITILNNIKTALASSLREIDIQGWYDQGKVIGVICTEITVFDEPSIERIFQKIHNRLVDKLGEELMSRIKISFYVYPEAKRKMSLGLPLSMKLYPELTDRDLSCRFAMFAKRTMDILGSAVGLFLSCPLFLIISVAIKVTSSGPIFFRQQRLGLNGKTFKMLKFRSMYWNCDANNHKEYIKKYITDQRNSAIEPGVFKLNVDDRITPVGRILRKTSLDELPQLLNVLRGDMSLVGPRPPISYEFDLYHAWHIRRLIGCKPGITGLWQISGRSRTTFDEMVRLDLQYMNEWSLWFDFRILMKTPIAVLAGHGAY
jgi:lipopolysaccharide/colanic/teichoic acid biosynthesis glycosyltransferase